MKIMLKGILLLMLLAQCTKEKRFENGIYGKWNIDKEGYYNVYSTSCGGPGETLISEKENTGTIELTKKPYPYKVAYSTTDQQYIGYWADAEGNEQEFAYEYFQKLNKTFNLTFFINGHTNVGIQLLTNKIFHFTTNTYYGGCEYSLYKYQLSK